MHMSAFFISSKVYIVPQPTVGRLGNFDRQTFRFFISGFKRCEAGQLLAKRGRSGNNFARVDLNAVWNEDEARKQVEQRN